MVIPGLYGSGAASPMKVAREELAEWRSICASRQLQAASHAPQDSSSGGDELGRGGS